MKISLNKVKSYVKIPENISDDELIKLIGSRLVEVEEVVDLAPAYRNIYIVKVVKAEPIPGTHLNLCEIDAGVHNREFKQLDNGLVQVVCGAPNVHAGMLAVWIAPGAIVPETYGNENFKISVRKLQGHESNGMLAGADELGFSSEHKAIAEIDPSFAKIGDDFATVFDLNDKILDVENKSLTHRPDCFGLIGFAREVAGILGVKFHEPAVFEHLEQKIASSHPQTISVKIQDSELCPRYTCAVFELADNQPSKYLTPSAVFLAKAGMRSIDPMVDLTNILMLETGQPLHAFDYDKLIAVGQHDRAEIIVRAAHDGEKLQLLDGKTIELQDFDIIITSNNIPVALAGAMGGKNTEVDASTRRVVLESATFSLYHLRKTQMAHGIFSEAITRFTKGQPAALCGAVLETAIKELVVTPISISDCYPDQSSKNVVKITTEEINQLLGTRYDTATIIKTLENVGFSIKTAQDQLTITTPVWRTDLHIEEDIIEEVGRLLGYDNIELTLPEKPFIEPEIDSAFQFKHRIRQILSRDLRMNELLTYSFVSRSLLTKANQDAADSYEIVNSISPELQCFRQQIVPSLLDKVRENIKSGHKSFTIYEMNQVARKSAGLDQEKVPIVKTDLGIVDLQDFYHLKAQILALFRRRLRLDISYRQLMPNSATAAMYPYLEPARSAELVWHDQVIGAFGEVRASVLRNFKLEGPISALEVGLDVLSQAKPELQAKIALSKFPSVERDLTLKLAADVAFWRVVEMLEDVLRAQEMIFEVAPSSVYQASADDTTKNLSFHLKFSSPERTLTSTEISAIMEKITAAAAKLGATVI